MRATWLAAPLLVVLAAAACSSGDGTPPPLDGASSSGSSGGSSSGASPDAGPAPDASPPRDGGADAPTGDVRFKIQLDYRFDKAGFFADPVRKQALEAACRIWGRALSSTFPNVPAGTFVLTRDPQVPAQPGGTFAIEYEIDDLVLFVGSADLAGSTTGISSPTAGLSGVTDATLRAALDQRYHGPAFQPWTGWVSFDTTTTFHFDPEPEKGAPVPAGSIDFVSVALHEIGHVLGFGTSDVFKSKVTAGAFTGAKAQALFGGPVPLSPDQSHVPNATMSGGARLLMDVSDATGTRYLPTPLDRAMFEDLGWTF